MFCIPHSIVRKKQAPMLPNTINATEPTSPSVQYKPKHFWSARPTVVPVNTKSQGRCSEVASSMRFRVPPSSPTTSTSSIRQQSASRTSSTSTSPIHDTLKDIRYRAVSLWPPRPDLVIETETKSHGIFCKSKTAIKALLKISKGSQVSHDQAKHCKHGIAPEKCKHCSSDAPITCGVYCGVINCTRCRRPASRSVSRVSSSLVDGSDGPGAGSNNNSTVSAEAPQLEPLRPTICLVEDVGDAISQISPATSRFSNAISSTDCSNLGGKADDAASLASTTPATSLDSVSILGTPIGSKEGVVDVYDGGNSDEYLDYHAIHHFLHAKAVPLIRIQPKLLLVTKGARISQSLLMGAHTTPTSNDGLSGSELRHEQHCSHGIGGCNHEAPDCEAPTTSSHSVTAAPATSTPLADRDCPAATSSDVPNPWTLPKTKARAMKLSSLSVTTHFTNRIRSVIGTKPTTIINPDEIPVSSISNVALIPTSSHLPAMCTNLLSETGKLPFDILQGLVRGAVYGDTSCQDLLLQIHADCMARSASYTPRELRIIRKGYLMLDLVCLQLAKFTTWDVIDGVRRQLFFQPQQDDKRLEQHVFGSFIHCAVRCGQLPKMTAVQILLLSSGGESCNDPESEAEKAIFEDKELFGPEGFINADLGHVIDRPIDVDMYGDMVKEEDIAEAERALSSGSMSGSSRSSQDNVERRLRAYSNEHQRYLNGDERPGVFDGSPTTNRTTVIVGNSQAGGSVQEQAITMQSAHLHKRTFSAASFKLMMGKMEKACSRTSTDSLSAQPSLSQGSTFVGKDQTSMHSHATMSSTSLASSTAKATKSSAKTFKSMIKSAKCHLRSRSQSPNDPSISLPH